MASPWYRPEALYVDRTGKSKMEVGGKKLVVIGGASLIGSHAVDQLLKADVGEVVMYDNLVRDSVENLPHVLQDPCVKVFDVSGDIPQVDILTICNVYGPCQDYKGACIVVIMTSGSDGQPGITNSAAESSGYDYRRNHLRGVMAGKRSLLLSTLREHTDAS